MTPDDFDNWLDGRRRATAGQRHVPERIFDAAAVVFDGVDVALCVCETRFGGGRFTAQDALHVFDAIEQERQRIVQREQQEKATVDLAMMAAELREALNDCLELATDAIGRDVRGWRTEADRLAAIRRVAALALGRDEGAADA